MITVSHSSIECFRSCHTRYFYEYDQCIKPKKKSWPLIDGEALHKALEIRYKNKSDQAGAEQIPLFYDTDDDDLEFVRHDIITPFQTDRDIDFMRFGTAATAIPDFVCWGALSFWRPSAGQRRAFYRDCCSVRRVLLGHRPRAPTPALDLNGPRAGRYGAVRGR